MKDERLIHHIMKKLPSEYAPFVSSFNTHRLTMGSAYHKPSFDAFIDILIKEQTHLMDQGLLTTSKTKALVVSDEKKSSQGGKSSNNNKKKQWKQKSQPETQHSSSQQGNSSSNKKGNNEKKDELILHIAKNKIMMSTIASIKELMS